MLQFDIYKKNARLHLLKGLEKILLDIDKAISIVRETQREADVVPRLMEGFSIDQVQAEYIAEIKLRHLNREYIIERIKEIRKATNNTALVLHGGSGVPDEEIKKAVAAGVRKMNFATDICYTFLDCCLEELQKPERVVAIDNFMKKPIETVKKLAVEKIKHHRRIGVVVDVGVEALGRLRTVQTNRTATPGQNTRGGIGPFSPIRGGMPNQCDQR